MKSAVYWSVDLAAGIRRVKGVRRTWACASGADGCGTGATGLVLTDIIQIE